MRFTPEEMQSAQRCVQAVFAPTPQQRWPLLDARLGAEVWVKHENHAPVGAFKLRGGLTYFEALRAREPACRGVISATRVFAPKPRPSEMPAPIASTFLVAPPTSTPTMSVEA